MSKRKNQQSKNDKDHLLQLSPFITPQRVIVALPNHLKLNQIILPLIKAYLRNKMKGKKITLGQSFLLLYVGKQ
jgi:hypothetical protein